MQPSTGGQLLADADHDKQDERGDHRREVEHAGAREDGADRGEDGLRHLEDGRVDRAAGIEARPGENDPQDDRDEQEDREDLDEQPERVHGLASELLGLLVGGLDRFGEGGAQAGGFEDEQGFGGGAAGGGDLVAQLGRVAAAFLGVAGGAEERLDDHRRGHIAAEADVDGGVDHRFHHEEHIGRAAGADGGSHVDVLLRVDVDLLAEHAEEESHLVTGGLGDGGGGGPDGHAFADLGGGVGDGADDGCVLEEIGDGSDANAGHDRHNGLIWLEGGGDLGRGGGELLRLDGDDDDLGAFDAVSGGVAGLDAVTRGEELAAGGDDIADGDAAGVGDVAGEGAGDHRFAHHAAADEGEPHRACSRSSSATKSSNGRLGSLSDSLMLIES